MLKIPSKRKNLKNIAGKQINKVEDFALHNNTFQRMVSTIYESKPFNFFIQQINRFRDFKLIEQTKKEPVPEHVAIIMDGNRRFAIEKGLQPHEGHHLGKQKIEEVLNWCFELGIKNLTVYAFSTENFNRTNKEVKTLMDLCKIELDKASKDSEIHKNQVKIRVLGKLESLPNDIYDSAKTIMNETKDYDKYSFNIALAYGGREELVQAIQKIADDVKKDKLEIDDIKESVVSDYLYTKDLPDPDLILRTSGEERISNFLLWQLAYSELYFSDVYWPAFQKRDFLKAIRNVQKRQRRYGE